MSPTGPTAAPEVVHIGQDALLGTWVLSCEELCMLILTLWIRLGGSLAVSDSHIIIKRCTYSTYIQIIGSSWALSGFKAAPDMALYTLFKNKTSHARPKKEPVMLKESHIQTNENNTVSCQMVVSVRIAPCSQLPRHKLQGWGARFQTGLVVVWQGHLKKV